MPFSRPYQDEETVQKQGFSELWVQKQKQNKTQTNNTKVDVVYIPKSGRLQRGILSVPAPRHQFQGFSQQLRAVLQIRLGERRALARASSAWGVASLVLATQQQRAGEGEEEEEEARRVWNVVKSHHGLGGAGG